MKSKLGFLYNLPFFSVIAEFLNNKTIRKRLVFTLGILILYRFLANIPPAGIEVGSYIQIFEANPLNNLFTLATGGSLENPSLVMMGLMAYVNASIIIQLLTTIIPKLEQLSEEGQTGKRIIGQYTRFLAVPLSIIQSIVIYLLLSRTSALISTEVNLDVVTFIATLAAGSLVLMWLGELITEKGLGNGSSVIISFSIISSLPSLITTDVGSISPVLTAFRSGQINLVEFLTAPTIIFLSSIIIGAFVLIILMVHINEAVRKIVIQYARRVTTARSNYLPIPINQAGVMPIIFASAMLTFPTIIAQILQLTTSPGSWGYRFSDFITNSFLGGFSTFGYNATYFVLIVLFTYFYILVVVKPADTADNLKKGGAFIPGIRPGVSTQNYISAVMIRLATVGGVFLAILAVLPALARTQVEIQSQQMGILSGIGGTSLLIVVSVILTSYRQIKSLKVSKSYDEYR